MKRFQQTIGIGFLALMVAAGLGWAQDLGTADASQGLTTAEFRALNSDGNSKKRAEKPIKLANQKAEEGTADRFGPWRTRIRSGRKSCGITLNPKETGSEQAEKMYHWRYWRLRGKERATNFSYAQPSRRPIYERKAYAGKAYSDYGISTHAARIEQKLHLWGG